MQSSKFINFFMATSLLCSPLLLTLNSFTTVSAGTTDGTVDLSAWQTNVSGDTTILTNYIGQAKDVVIPLSGDLGTKNVKITKQALRQAATVADGKGGTLSNSTNDTTGTGLVADNSTDDNSNDDVVDYSGTFKDLKSIVKIDLSKLKICAQDGTKGKDVTASSGFYSGGYSWVIGEDGQAGESLDVSSMFENCESLKEVFLDSFEGIGGNGGDGGNGKGDNFNAVSYVNPLIAGGKGGNGGYAGNFIAKNMFANTKSLYLINLNQFVGQSGKGGDGGDGIGGKGTAGTTGSEGIMGAAGYGGIGYNGGDGYGGDAVAGGIGVRGANGTSSHLSGYNGGTGQGGMGGSARGGNGYGGNGGNAYGGNAETGTGGTGGTGGNGGTGGTGGTGQGGQGGTAHAGDAYGDGNGGNAQGGQGGTGTGGNGGNGGYAGAGQGGQGGQGGTGQGGQGGNAYGGDSGTGQGGTGTGGQGGTGIGGQGGNGEGGQGGNGQKKDGSQGTNNDGGAFPSYTVEDMGKKDFELYQAYTGVTDKSNMFCPIALYEFSLIKETGFNVDDLKQNIAALRKTDTGKGENLLSEELDNVLITAKDQSGSTVDLINVTNPGKYTIVYSYGGKDVSVDLTVKGGAIITKDLTLGTGDVWKPEDNFVKAIDDNNQSLSFDQLIVTGADQVDLSKAGSYSITFTYKGDTKEISSEAKINVIDIQTKSLTLNKGDKFEIYDALVSVTNTDKKIHTDRLYFEQNVIVKAKDKNNGISVNLSEITDNPGTYTITYTYEGISRSVDILVESASLIDQSILPTNIDFGSAKIQYKKNEVLDGQTNGKPTEGKLEIKDTRSKTGEGYKVKVAQTRPFTGKITKKILNGAKLSFQTGAIVNSEQLSIPGGNQTIQLTPEQEIIVLATVQGQSRGTTILPLHSFQLLIPKETEKLKDSYETTLTWTLSDAP